MADYKQDDLFHVASQYLPGGVCSSARVHKALNRPLYVRRAKGSRIIDTEGKEYLDLFMSFGAGLVGHGHPLIQRAIRDALELGFPCAYENEYQILLAQKLSRVVPCIDMVRFALSGTETTYYAVKLAREYTGRSKVVKFEGHFHGFNDYLAYNYWPPPDGMWPKFTPAVDGVPESFQRETIVLPFNDFEVLEETLTQRGTEVAAVILEPLNYNSGGIHPLPGYLQKLRELTARQGIVLIFDEILSGFRTGPGGMQEYYGVTPDLCTLGKCIAGGLPLSVFGGRREIMSHIAPLGKAQHSGTYNALWLSVMAGLAFLEIVTQPDFYTDLLAKCDRLYDGINHMMQRIGIQGRVNGTGARFSFFFGPLAEREQIVNYRDTAQNDWETTMSFCSKALQHGLYLHSAWHHGISGMHSDADIDLALERIEAALTDLKQEAGTKTVSRAGAPTLF